MVSETSSYDIVPAVAKTFTYDLAGRRTGMIWPDSYTLGYDYDNAGSVTAVKEGGTTVLASFAYDDLGRRTGRSVPANGTGASYGYDAASRLTSLGLTGGGTSATSLTLGGYNPAGEIGSRTLSNDSYAWIGGYNVNRSYTANSLNQYATVAGAALGYDTNGNLTSSGGASFGYNADNRLVTGGGATLRYDALGRLIHSSANGGTRFDYDGDRLIAEYSTAGTLLRRYVHGPGIDEPLMWL